MSINSIAFISNTITKPFERFLKSYKVTHYPLDSVIEQLYSKIEEDLAVILLDIKFFKDNSSFESLKNALIEFRNNNSSKVIINTQFESFFSIYAPNDLLEENSLLELNKKIVSLQSEILDVAILDFYSLIKTHGSKNLINERNSYLFQTPFTRTAIELLSNEVEKIIELFKTPRIKAIAIDADNTLWGGIVGEEGINGIKIDENYPGIVYKKFQQYILRLKESGIILILLSKNDEPMVKEVFEKRLMPLSLDDFVSYAINWNSKSENLLKILKELNLTRTGIIFLDDSNSELHEMRERLGIESYKMNPDEPLENIKTLSDIVSLKALHVTDEDLKKSSLYKDEQERLNLSSIINSKDDFIASLEIIINVSCNDESHLERITQLINKTNQFNLTTKRYEASQIKEFMKSAKVYDFSVKDKFGEMGIVGVVIVKDNKIDTFVMSCRVLGRRIEQRVLNFITSKHDNLKASYSKTPKNSLVENFYEENGFELIESAKDKEYRYKNKNEINSSIKVHYNG